MSTGKLRDHIHLGECLGSGSRRMLGVGPRTITLNGVKFENCILTNWSAKYGIKTTYSEGVAAEYEYTQEDEVDVTFRLQGGSTVRVQGNVRLTGD